MPLGDGRKPFWTCFACRGTPTWWIAEGYHDHVRDVHPEVYSYDEFYNSGTATSTPPESLIDPPPHEITYTIGLKDVRAAILEQASKLVTENRNKSYGEPENNFKRIASLWNSYLQGKHSEWQFDLDPSDVAIMMVLMKIARLEENTENWDSWLDAIGYLACGAQTIWDNPPEV